MEIEKVYFKSEGNKIYGMLHLPDQENPPCVIASHGLLSSKDSENILPLEITFQKKGSPCYDLTLVELGRVRVRLKKIP